MPKTKINIDLSKIKKEYLAFGSLALGVIIVFMAYANIFTPLLKKNAQLSAQIKQKTADIQRGKIGPQALQKLQLEINQLKTQVDYYQKMLPVQTDIPQVLKELNQIAERLKIKFDSVTPLEIEQTPLPESDLLLLEIPIRIKMQCGYHQLGIFINQIENSTRFMKITQLRIDSNTRDVWQHRAELVIGSYRLISK